MRWMVFVLIDGVKAMNRIPAYGPGMEVRCQCLACPSVVNDPFTEIPPWLEGVFCSESLWGFFTVGFFFYVCFCFGFSFRRREKQKQQRE